MKREVFNEDVNENITDVPDLQTDFNDYVNEEELLALEQEQQMIDMMEEQALLEQAEEQAIIDAYIEQQLIEQSLLDQTDEEAQLDYEDQQQFDDEPTVTKPKAKQQKPTISGKVSDEEESDDEQDDDVPRNVVAHRQVLQLMRQHNHLDICVKKEEGMFLYTNEYVHQHEKDQRYDARIMRYNLMESLIKNRHINKMSSMQMATEILQQTKEDITVKSLSNTISSEIRKLEEIKEEKNERIS